MVISKSTYFADKKYKSMWYLHEGENGFVQIEGPTSKATFEKRSQSTSWSPEVINIMFLSSYFLCFFVVSIWIAHVDVGVFNRCSQSLILNIETHQIF